MISYLLVVEQHRTHFFFQAEDGIRDYKVTGVQTCALPILSMSHVDDGTLHAYLDGELSPAEVQGVDAHLAQCPACRGRLDEERALITRAGELLAVRRDRKSTRLNSSHLVISYAVFCLKKKKH